MYNNAVASISTICFRLPFRLTKELGILQGISEQFVHLGDP